MLLQVTESYTSISSGKPPCNQSIKRQLLQASEPPCPPSLLGIVLKVVILIMQ
jgi:hypothetical protein